jgi:drug/metabolite transporter (DMT)-like permease
MGALSVVICAILSSIFLNEKLTFFGWMGCALCIVSITYSSSFRELMPARLVQLSLLSTVSITPNVYYIPKLISGA